MDGNTVGIVGGGAAGMMAAIAAAESGARVTLLEGNDRLGKKILVTASAIWETRSWIWRNIIPAARLFWRIVWEGSARWRRFPFSRA